MILLDLIKRRIINQKKEESDIWTKDVYRYRNTFEVLS